ncbi:MAG: class A beta-lactamase-related serine hydrolase, partial [Deltaproteobacteria bacterium]
MAWALGCVATGAEGEGGPPSRRHGQGGTDGAAADGRRVGRPDLGDRVPPAVAKAIRRSLDSGDLSSVEIAAFSGGSLRYALQVGASVTGARPLGSLTKTMVASAILDLVRAGRLELDARAADLLPEAAPVVGEARVGDLLAHRGGVVADWLAGMWMDDPPDWRSSWREMAHERPAGPPRTRTHYSNVGFVVLGALIERISGRPFEAVVRERVVERLGLGPSVTFERPAGLAEPATRLVPAGGAYGRAWDLGPLLHEAAEGAREGGAHPCAPPGRALSADLDRTWTLGWGAVRGELPSAQPLCWHSGRTVDHAAFAVVLPATDYGVVVLARGPGAEGWGARLATLAAAAADPRVAEPRRTSPALADLGVQSGVYVTESGIVRIRGDRAGGDVHFEDRAGRLVPSGAGRYAVLGHDGPAFSFVHVGGDVLLAASSGGVHEPVGLRVEPSSAAPAAWRNLPSCYDVEDPYVGPVGRGILRFEGRWPVLRVRADVGPGVDAVLVLAATEAPEVARVVGVHRAAGSIVRR